MKRPLWYFGCRDDKRNFVNRNLSLFCAPLFFPSCYSISKHDRQRSNNSNSSSLFMVTYGFSLWGYLRPCIYGQRRRLCLWEIRLELNLHLFIFSVVIKNEIEHCPTDWPRDVSSYSVLFCYPNQPRCWKKKSWFYFKIIVHFKKDSSLSERFGWIIFFALVFVQANRLNDWILLHFVNSENLIRIAFQCLQLIVTDFLPLMPWRCLPLCLETTSKFGSQPQELNISLTAIGLMVRLLFSWIRYFV